MPTEEAIQGRQKDTYLGSRAGGPLKEPQETHKTARGEGSEQDKERGIQNSRKQAGCVHHVRVRVCVDAFSEPCEATRGNGHALCIQKQAYTKQKKRGVVCAESEKAGIRCRQ